MSSLPEIRQIESRILELGSKVRSEVIAYSEKDDLRMPIHKITFGSRDPEAPTLGFVGGVHGLERIGAQVCLSLFSSVAELSQWDRSFQRTLQDIRIFFIPTVNPVGIYRKTRSNPRGVDLMRNAPIDADNPNRYLGGHRISPKLPWYRGVEGAPMEIESQALVDAVKSEIHDSRLAITLDIHSGFGLRDRLWFPYAKSIKPYPELPLVYSLNNLLEKTYPHHFYKVEPQAKNYTTHGDLWDYLYEQHQGMQRQKKYLPLCLEMGSWLWVKKNPWQLFRPEGPFNPMIGHRHERTLRRHNTLMEFLIRAVDSSESWADLNSQQSQLFDTKARERWYAGN
jgi:hypothetical protein